VLIKVHLLAKPMGSHGLHWFTRYISINLLHGHNGVELIKFKFKACQARSIYHYKKLKIKVLKCNADIFFDQCKPWDPIGTANECTLINTISL